MLVNTFQNENQSPSSVSQGWVSLPPPQSHTLHPHKARVLRLNSFYLKEGNFSLSFFVAILCVLTQPEYYCHLLSIAPGSIYLFPIIFPYTLFPSTLLSSQFLFSASLSSVSFSNNWVYILSFEEASTGLLPPIFRSALSCLALND